MILLPIVLATLATLVAGFLAWWEYRRTRELFTPWMLFLAYAALDVFLPAVVFLMTEPPSLADWIVPLRKDDIASSTLLYVVALVFFALSYFSASGHKAARADGSVWRALAYLELRLRYVYAGLLIAGGWYVSHQLTLIGRAGSSDAYLSNKFRERLQPDIFASKSLLDFVFNQFAPAMLPIVLVLVGILFFFRYRYGKRVLWGWVFPAGAWILTLTTFYRGYQLNFFLSLALIETCRHRAAKLHPETGLGRPVPARARTSVTLRTKVLTAVAVLFFLVYGAFRHYNSSFQYGRPVSVSAAVTSQGGELLRGWGIVGLTSILRSYPDSGSRLGGSSIVTTFFMPVPRPLWPAKPERYGAEAVTRRMGWPTTTQSAITMPGELYANFGLLGVPLVVAFGALFRMVYRSRLHPKLFFVYAFFVPYAVLLTHWMSSTGFMTSVTQYSLAVGVALLVLGRGEPSAREDMERHDPRHQEAGPLVLSGAGGRWGNTATGETSAPIALRRDP